LESFVEKAINFLLYGKLFGFRKDFFLLRENKLFGFRKDFSL
jgi:hypothetical protein